MNLHNIYILGRYCRIKSVIFFKKAQASQRKCQEEERLLLMILWVIIELPKRNILKSDKGFLTTRKPTRKKKSDIADK